MNMRLLMVMLTMLFVLSGLAFGTYRRDGPIFEGGPAMADPKRDSALPKTPLTTQPGTEPAASSPPATTPQASPPPTLPPDSAQGPPPEATAPPPDAGEGQPGSTEAAPIRVKEITVELHELLNFSDPKVTDNWGQRAKDKYTEASLADVMESLIHDKQLEPVQVFRNEHGRWELLTGHRRVAAMYILASRKVAGFSLTMPVLALEVTGGTFQDHLVRSVADNETSVKLDQKERLQVAAKFAKAGVGKERAASALAISVKSYERDLRVATNPRMLAHVLQDHLNPGDASTLIQKGEKNPRMSEFLDYLDGWVERTEKKIKEDDLLSRAETDKGLKASDLLVKNHLEAPVFDGWIDSLERNKPFSDTAEFNFEGKLDKKGRLRVERLNVDINDASVKSLVKLGSKLTQLGKRVLAAASKKHRLELMDEPMGPQAAVMNDKSPYDTTILAEFGLENAAEELERELSTDESTENEESKDEMEDESKDGNE
jgi:ParB-like chromosome segregation protein Spo0J